MASSTKIQISAYALLEYIYSGESRNISESTFYKIKNDDRNISIIINDDKSATFSKNVLDYTFIETNTHGLVAHADRDRSFVVEELSDEIDVDKNLNIPLTYNVKYDTVRVHILAGYNLEGLSGFGVRIGADLNGGGRSYLASQIYTIGENTLQNNPVPFSISERVYDKYLEFKIPSLSFINEQFYNLSTLNDKQLGYYLSGNNKGFTKESQIFIEFYQFTTPNEDNDILTYYANKTVETSISQIDQNSLISATIQESAQGDYFEYFATYNDEFIDDYLSELNSIGKQYIVINDIKVYESYATLTRKKVHDVSIIQESDFDKPNVFRPVISDDAFSFTIEYSMRLINKQENTQIIKTSSITLDTNTARKYGRSMSKIEIKESSAPVKIYNRITKAIYEANFNRQVPSGQIAPQKEVIRFIKEYNISTSSSHSIMSAGNVIKEKSLKDDNYIYANGKGLIYITPFDNFIRLNLFNRRFDESNEPLEISEFLKQDTNAYQRLSLVFYSNNGSKKYIQALDGHIEGNSVTFGITSLDANKIVEYNNTRFNLVYTNEAGQDMSIFEGDFVTSVEELERRRDLLYTKAVDKKIKEITEVYDNTQKKFDVLKNEVSKISSTGAVTSNNFVSERAKPLDSQFTKTEKIGSGLEIKTDNSLKIEDIKDPRQFDSQYVLTEDAMKFNQLDIIKRAQADFIKSSKNVLNKEIVNIKENLSKGLEFDLSKSINPDSIKTDITQLNFVELPGKNTNFFLDSSIKNIKPAFMSENISKNNTQL